MKTWLFCFFALCDLRHRKKKLINMICFRKKEKIGLSDVCMQGKCIGRPEKGLLASFIKWINHNWVYIKSCIPSVRLSPTHRSVFVNKNNLPNHWLFGALIWIFKEKLIHGNGHSHFYLYGASDTPVVFPVLISRFC